ncbi:MAG: hypothetical protein H7Z40_11525 [Phycisphaerae bacterium]|nr:hypothetical protein [Gemmatimonadaceae bacterium]
MQVTRPGAAEKAGLKVPVLLLSSPYIAPTNGNAVNWDVHQELGAPSPTRTNPSFRPFSETMRLNQGPTAWVSRGFAAVTVENSCTGLASGCPTVGDSIENITPKFAIDWLNGRAKGYTTLDGTVEVNATSWSSGKVGMTGTSYEGTMPLAAAVTGLKLAANKAAVNLSVYLVTLPYDSTRIGNAGQRGDVTRGWADPQNYKSLKGDGDFVTMARGEPLKPGQFYTKTFPLDANDQIIPPGQQLGIMIFSSDAGCTLRPAPGSELTIDLDGTSFTLPVVGGKTKLQAALGAK